MNFITILEKLVSYKTVSEQTNKEIASFIIDYLKDLNFEATKIEGEKGRFNIYSRIGPITDGGIILSGHTDVVPVEGQIWSTNPFKLIKKGDKLFGRGTTDMKGFIAVVLSLIKEINVSKLKRPIHLVFSYDEEVGCLGIQKLVPFLLKLRPKAKFCIVGEPTEMKLVNQHKGKKNYYVCFNGFESHSSLVEDGVNAINYCVKFIEYLIKKQSQIKRNKDLNFNPSFSTINVGKINGGIAVNIIPRQCEIEFEIRDTPNFNTMKLINEIKQYLDKLESEMKIKNTNCSIRLQEQNTFPPLNTDDNAEIISLCLNNLNSNTVDTVSFGTEAGVFNKLNLQTVVCGPGSIKQAHKPNEYIKISQLKKCEIFLKKIIKSLHK